MTELKLEERVSFIFYFMAHVSLGPTFHLSSSEHQRYYGNLSQRVKDQFPHLSCAWPHNQVDNKMSAVSVVYRFQEISLKIRSVPLKACSKLSFVLVLHKCMESSRGLTAIWVLGSGGQNGKARQEKLSVTLNHRS